MTGLSVKLGSGCRLRGQTVGVYRMFVGGRLEKVKSCMGKVWSERCAERSFYFYFEDLVYDV